MSRTIKNKNTMDKEQIIILIKNKAWNYRWALNNLDLNDDEKHRLRAKSDALFDLLTDMR